jgi:hypothetical protein
MVIRNIIFSMIFLFLVPFLNAHVRYVGKEKVFVTGVLESASSHISYVRIKNKPYIIKQKKDNTKQIMAVAREALASYIAKELQVAQFVQIIAATDFMPGKLYPSYPATLHTLAPGKMVSQLHGHKYFLLSLKQRYFQGKKITGKWLTETIIDQITWHKDLALIIALDLFISNTDRNRRNLFYDEVTDSFCAIDMENIYRRNVAEMACEKLYEMINIKKKKFTPQEIEALKVVKHTLEFLYKKYPPYKTIAHFDKYLFFAGYVQDGSILYTKLAKKVERHKNMIQQSYQSTRELILILNEIIKRSNE